MLQSHQVLSFLRPHSIARDWSQRELAEFYRVEAALINSGVSVCTDRGLSDEGDPWFVFCRQDTDEVIVHFARIDGEYIVVSNLKDAVMRGRDFNTLVRQLLNDHPYVLPKSTHQRQTVYLHPAALLAALIVTGYLKSSEISGTQDDSGQGGEKIWSSLLGGHGLVALSAVAIAAAWDMSVANPLHKLAELAWFDDAHTASDHIDHLNVAHQQGESVLPDFHSLSLSNLPGVDSHIVLSAQASAHFEAVVQNGASDVALQAQADLPAWVHADHGAEHSQDQEISVVANLTQIVHGGAEFAADDDRAQVKPSGDVPVEKTSGATKQTSDGQASSVPHGSSVAVAAAPQADAPSDAMNTLYHALNLDTGSIQTVNLTASTLADAVQSTLSEFNVGGPAASSKGLSTASDEALVTHGIQYGAESLMTTHLQSEPVRTFDAAAQHEISEFISQTSDWRIETFGNDILIVDADHSHYTASHFGLETWVMADGSTISILGQAASHGSGSLLAA